MKKLFVILSLVFASLSLAEETAPAVPAAPAKTHVKSHDLFEFDMPGQWTLKPADKIDLQDGLTMYPGGALNGQEGLTYMAFVDAKHKTSEKNLEDVPMTVAGPIISRAEKKGGTEVDRKLEALTEGDKDRSFYVINLKSPTGQPLSISGIVIRTASRIYVIQAIRPTAVDKKTWQEIAKSFKEL